MGEGTSSLVSETRLSRLASGRFGGGVGGGNRGLYLLTSFSAKCSWSFRNRSVLFCPLEDGIVGGGGGGGGGGAEGVSLDTDMNESN